MNILIVDDIPIFRKTYRIDPWYLSSKGHLITVICPKPIKVTRSLAEDPNVEFIFTLPFKQVKSGKDLINKFLHLILTTVKIRSLIKRRNYDLIRAVGFLSAYSSLVARGNYSIPVISNLTDFYSDLYRYFMLPLSSVASRILHKMESKIVTESDILFVDSSTMRRYWTYWGLNEKKCIVLPNGFDEELYQPNSRSDKIRADYGIDESTKIVLYSGDISHMDGLDVLIDAAPEIVKQMKARFLILGSGPETYLTRLKKMIKDRDLEKSVTFAGWVSYGSVPKYIATADVCVAPFRINYTSNSTECLKIVEYVAMTKPVVASKADGLMELFGDVLNYVAPENPQALAETIIRVLRRGPLNQKIFEKMSLVRKKLTWKSIWINEEKIFQILLNNKINDFRVFDIF